MGLAEYRRMRNFRVTREPRGGRRRKAGVRLRYFIQEHHARRLHYDFRLELDGVLKSWAVPKGPSLDPGVRRLAVHVEDHPLEYGPFEGEIPAGQYGAGKVFQWDRGEWIPDGDARAGFAKGHLKFALKGRRLNGTWNLFSIDRERKNWMLVRSRKEPGRRGPPAPVPRVEPQLATLGSAVPAGDEWIHEIKLDGYRILAELRAGKAVLRSRRGLDWTSQFPGVANAVEALPARSALLDGEVVVMDGKGRSDFSALKDALSGSGGEPLYVAFDLLHLDGEDLRERPLLERKEALAKLVRGEVRFSEHVAGRGADMFREACRLSLEGVISKLKDAPYRSGRSTDWMKTKCVKEQEFVIAGWSAPRGSRKGFGALILGAREGGKLRYAGRVGTGFTASSLRELSAAMKPLAAKDPPFAEVPRGEKHAHWLEPKLVAQVSFSEWTRDGSLRHPSFKGLRGDKPASEVAVERPAPAARLTHPERVLDEKSGLTKKGLADYYASILPRVLPHVAGRPLALLRCPEGGDKPCFYQKHESSAFGPSVRGKDGEDFVWIEDERGLAALVQGGALEIHPWACRVEDVERADRAVFDLDPSPGTPWKDVVAAAREVRERLERLKLPAFLKTTGGKGLHVVVPLAPTPWPELKAFARAFAELMAADSPKAYTTELRKASRRGRLFVDWLRNQRGATAVAAYSTRARPGAPVSTPLGWDELKASLDPSRLDWRSVPRRIARRTDPWDGFEAARRELPKP